MNDSPIAKLTDVNVHHECAIAGLIAADDMRAEGRFEPSSDNALAIVQIQATLALAYEQRTANMLAAFGQLMDGESETFLGERVDGYALAGAIKARIISPAPEPGEIVVPVPVLPTKALGTKESYYLRTAARNIQQGYSIGGSGVTQMILRLLTDAAESLEAEGL